MRGLRRFFDLQIGDFWGIEDIFYSPEVTSWTLKGRWVDDSRFDIVPKESYKQELVRQNEDRLKELEEYYEKKKREIKEERDRLLGKNKEHEK
jgi:hypothetical protein